jgi:hypothetical protein
VLKILNLESSGYQCQEMIKDLQHYPHFAVTFLGDTQILLHILQGIKASMYAKRGLKPLGH